MGARHRGYELLFPLASGGIGSVSLVVKREGEFERLYALKRLRPQLADEPEVRRMFLREARIAGLLRHPHVVPVVDVGEDAQGPFLVMEYVRGVTLSEHMQQLGKRGELPLPWRVGLDIGRQVALGLAAVHELTDHEGTHLGLVHRDVSPQNIMLSMDGSVRLTDFGIATTQASEIRTETGILKGKLGYMAPEQLQFERATSRSDLFSLGVVLYELFAGRRLYPRVKTDPMAGAKRILHEPPPDLLDERSDAPPALVALLFALMSKDPAGRPPSARVVARRLGEVLEAVEEEDEPTLPELLAHVHGDWQSERSEQVRHALAGLPRPGAPSEAPPARRPKRRWVAAAAAVVIGLSTAGVGAWAWMSQPGDSEPPPEIAVPPIAAAPPRPSEPSSESTSPPGEAIDMEDNLSPEAEPSSPPPSTEVADGARADGVGRVEPGARATRRRTRRPRRRSASPSEAQPTGPASGFRLRGWRGSGR